MLLVELALMIQLFVLCRTCQGYRLGLRDLRWVEGVWVGFFTRYWANLYDDKKCNYTVPIEKK